MARINTEKMDRVVDRYGQEIAFGKVKKNEWGEFIVKVYVDGEYSEDRTIYADSREDAEATKADAIKRYADRTAEAQKQIKAEEKAKKAEVKAYIERLKKERKKLYVKINKGVELDTFESTDLDQLNGAILAAQVVYGIVFGNKEEVQG